MIKTNTIFKISNDFKKIIGKDKIYEQYVLEILNSSIFFKHNTLKKLDSNESHGEPDYVDTKNIGYDAKLVCSEKECKALCADKNINVFIEEISKQNNDIYECVVGVKTGGSIYDILVHQLDKRSTENKNLVFLFTFPICHSLSTLISNYVICTPLHIVIDQIKNKIRGREIYFISPTLDGLFEVIRLKQFEYCFVRHEALHNIINWTITF